jgi:ribose transport system substrate-binding protein
MMLSTWGQLRNVAFLVAAVLLGVTAACGSSTTTSGGGTISAENLAYVQAQVTKYEAVPTFVAPGPAFDATKAKGKLIYYIPLALNPFNTAIANAAKEAGERAGVKVVIFPSTGNPSEWVAGMQTAITAHANLIDDLGVNPAVLVPQFAAAKAANIPITLSGFYDPSQTPSPDVKGGADFPFMIAGQLMADYAIAQTKGNLNAVVLLSSDIPQTAPVMKGMQDEITNHCGSSCHLTLVDQPVTAWTSFTGATQTALVKDPNVNYVIPIYDGMASFALAGIRAASRTNVKIATFNGTPAVLQEMTSGNIVVMDLGVSAAWIGYLEMDNDLRVLTGQAPIFSTIPPRLFDSTNINEAGNPPNLESGYGSDFKAQFAKLWGI